MARDKALQARATDNLTAARIFIGNAQSDLEVALARAKETYVAAQNMSTYEFTISLDGVAADPKLPPTGDTIVPNIALAGLVVGAFLLLSGAFMYRRSRRRA